jgi:TPR repeat protein
MKTQLKLPVVLVVLFLVLLSGLISQVSAEGKKDIFLQAYESYLKKNFKLALIHWKFLAEKGHANAQYFLGIMYLNGQGTEINLTEAAYWFQASAEQGDVGAQYLIGEMNLKGMGLAQDYQKAGAWFKKAAEKDYPDAQYRLGEWYAEGKGGDKNLILSYVWLKLAGANGIQKADEKGKQIQSQLTSLEIKHANRLAYQLYEQMQQN